MDTSSCIARCVRPGPVDTWDTEFRWRGPDGLHDGTIDDTWRRVAAAAASAEGSHAVMWTYPFLDGFRHGRLLPDEHFLRTLGTPRPQRSPEEPAAVVNAAAFVDGPPSTRNRFDQDGFIAAAALAVRFLDDAASSTGDGRHALRLRIGVIGLADALDALGLPYDSVEGRQQAARVARALAQGCLRASIELAEERGSRFPRALFRARAERLQQCGMPPGLVERALRSGLYHEALTAIDPHPLLARLAGVVDSIDPSPSARTPATHAFSAQRAMRSAIQPWIDEPICELFAAWQPAVTAAPPATAAAVPPVVKAPSRRRTRPVSDREEA